jgi:hypothetical protein
VTRSEERDLVSIASIWKNGSLCNLRRYLFLQIVAKDTRSLSSERVTCGGKKALVMCDVISSWKKGVGDV